MSTPLTDTYEMIRAILGDFHPTYQRYTDSAIASVARTVVKLGEVPGYTLAPDNISIMPTLATARDLAILVYKAAYRLLLPNAAAYAYDTRALKERFGEQRLFVLALQEAIYATAESGEDGVVFGSFQSLYAWVNGMTGLSLAGQLIEARVSQPLAVATIVPGFRDANYSQ